MKSRGFPRWLKILSISIAVVLVGFLVYRAVLAPGLGSLRDASARVRGLEVELTEVEEM